MSKTPYYDNVILPERKRNWKEYCFREKPLPPKVYGERFEKNVKVK